MHTCPSPMCIDQPADLSGPSVSTHTLKHLVETALFSRNDKEKRQTPTGVQFNHHYWVDGGFITHINNKDFTPSVKYRVQTISYSWGRIPSTTLPRSGYCSRSNSAVSSPPRLHHEHNSGKSRGLPFETQKHSKLTYGDCVTSGNRG